MQINATLSFSLSLSSLPPSLSRFLSQQQTKTRFITFANVCGVSTTTIAGFKLLKPPALRDVHAALGKGVRDQLATVQVSPAHWF